MSSPVEEIKNRLSVEEVVGSYIELKSHGKTLKALCPFHQEKTPSFVVSQERQSFYCFGCSKGGDIFTFVEEFEGVDFKGALKILADKAGVDINLYQGNPQEKEERETLYEILDTASRLYADSFYSTEGAQTYVKRRGVTDKTASLFKLGFAPDSWSFILDHLTQKGFREIDIEKAGLLIKRKNGGYYDRFRNRVMFPICDSSGRTVGFSGRTLSADDKTAKYINTPETPVFKKRDTLFGIDKAKLAIRKLGFAILVEGQMDIVLSHQAGFRNTVATSGTALRGRDDEGESGISNLELVKRISKNLVVAFDSDRAGKEAGVKNATLALTLGMDVKIAELPEGKDPADIILESKQAWKDVIKQSRDVIEFQLNEISRSSKSKKDILKRVRGEVFTTILKVPSSIEREYYLNMVAETLGMRSETVLDEFESFQSNTQKTSARSDAQGSNSKQQAAEQPSYKPPEDEKLLLAAYITVLTQKTDSAEVTEEYSESLQKEYSATFGEPPGKVLENTETQDRERYLFESEARMKSLKESKREVEFLLKRIKIRELEHKTRLVLEDIRKAEEEADKERTLALLEDYNNLSKELQTLKETK